MSTKHDAGLKALFGLVKAGMLARLAVATPIKVKKPKKARRRLGYPASVDKRARDGLSLAGYDRAVSAWLVSGRAGPKPARCPPRRVRA